MAVCRPRLAKALSPAPPAKRPEGDLGGHQPPWHPTQRECGARPVGVCKTATSPMAFEYRSHGGGTQNSGQQERASGGTTDDSMWGSNFFTAQPATHSAPPVRALPLGWYRQG